MGKVTVDVIEQYEEKLQRINLQRHRWLIASSIVLIGAIALIFSWDWMSGLESKSIWWGIVSIMLLVSINWWYWTMKVVRVIICYQEIEFQLIKEIHDQIKKVKIDLKEAFKLSGL